jgi:hypothetical protein
MKQLREAHQEDAGSGAGGLLAEAAANLVHVDRPSLGDQLLQGRLGQSAGLCVQDDLVTDDQPPGLTDRPPIRNV